ncbi:HNH endonuclease [Myceligenerans salitolerans]|uniref:HNH endonuclease n=1 Tax=Myceligenerans salitolerans TaxID=1230528 RepID=A0ABS3I8D9_9MICO|nr:HNH endonuclease [Myceligenerans salitolerans]MBO0608357.1 HNH endonuclease [Myceligenerans salitolerans]
MADVLVLNAGYEPLHRVSVRHAIGMLVREVAVVEEAVDGRTFGPFPLPRVLRLVRYVAMRWLYKRNGAPACTKQGVKRRDGACAYCGGPADTVDHVVPRSRGGPSTWLNLVAACYECNSFKADRTPAEAGMLLYLTPYVPRAEYARARLQRAARIA